jgi:hypothetical protein
MCSRHKPTHTWAGGNAENDQRWNWVSVFNCSTHVLETWEDACLGMEWHGMAWHGGGAGYGWGMGIHIGYSIAGTVLPKGTVR